MRFSTDIIVGANGQEVRNANWQDMLGGYNAAFTVRSLADIATLKAFFAVCRGREVSFNVKDYADYSVTSFTVLTGTANGTNLAFQLVKRYTDALGNVYIRNICHIKEAASVVVRVNGVTKTAGTHYNASLTTGVVTFTGGNAPPNGATVDATIAEFYVPSRFDTDELDVELLTFWVTSGADYANVQIPDIPIVEVRDAS